MKKTFMIIIGVVLACVISIDLGLFWWNTDSNRLNRQLKLGYSYLEDTKYDEAVAAFELALEIDPNNVEAYFGLTDAYFNNQNYSKALKTAQEGYENTKDERLNEKIREIMYEIYLKEAQEKISRAAYEEAIEILNKAIELSNGDMRAQELLESIKLSSTVNEENQENKEYIELNLDKFINSITFSGKNGFECLDVTEEDVITYYGLNLGAAEYNETNKYYSWMEHINQPNETDKILSLNNDGTRYDYFAINGYTPTRRSTSYDFYEKENDPKGLVTRLEVAGLNADFTLFDGFAPYIYENNCISGEAFLNSLDLGEADIEKIKQGKTIYFHSGFGDGYINYDKNYSGGNRLSYVMVIEKDTSSKYVIRVIENEINDGDFSMSIIISHF